MLIISFQPNTYSGAPTVLMVIITDKAEPYSQTLLDVLQLVTHSQFFLKDLNDLFLGTYY